MSGAMPSQAGAPCRHCLGALVVEIVGDRTWRCSAGIVHAAADDAPPERSARDFEMSEALGLVEQELAEARATWEVTGKVELEAVDAALELLRGIQ